MPFLREGREKIKNLVRTCAPIADILNYLTRLYEFEDKLRRFGFREQEHQINTIDWPVEERQPYVTKWERDRELERLKPPEKIDYDAIDVIPKNWDPA